MVVLSRKFLSLTLIFLLVFLAPRAAVSDHIVTPNDLQSAITNSVAQREANIDRVQHFLSSEPAKQAMKQMKVDPVKITNTVSVLSNEELASLASRVDTAEKQFAAGYHMSTHQLITLLIVIILVIAIVVIVQEVD